MAKKSSKKTAKTDPTAAGKPVVEQRLERLRERIRAAEVDALLIQNLVNINYLTGFAGSHGLLIVDGEAARLVTDGRYWEIAEGLLAESGSSARIVAEPKGGKDEFFKDLFKDLGYGKLGFEGSLSVDAFDKLKERTTGAKTKLAKVSGQVEELRQVKDAGEIKAIRKAAKVADQMMEVAFQNIRSGVREWEVSLAIRRAAEDLGVRGESFTNIVASGPNASRPHHSPGKRKMKKGDMVTVDLGAVVDGYCSDLTRNPVIGKASRDYEKMYAACLDANEAVIKACRAGAICRELDAMAREIVKSHGFPDFNHGLGHAVGMEIHESPRFSADTNEDVKLVPGNVMTIEPGIYVPGFGGVRIEDLVVVEEGGCRVLSKSPKELRVL
ncbi:MAG: Xaa-Pro peptidase family protein [Sumerlaeia bacterium]